MPNIKYWLATCNVLLLPTVLLLWSPGVIHFYIILFCLLFFPLPFSLLLLFQWQKVAHLVACWWMYTQHMECAWDQPNSWLHFCKADTLLLNLPGILNLLLFLGEDPHSVLFKEPWCSDDQLRPHKRKYVLSWLSSLWSIYIYRPIYMCVYNNVCF